MNEKKVGWQYEPAYNPAGPFTANVEFDVQLESEHKLALYHAAFVQSHVDFFLAAAVTIFSIHVSILCFAAQSAPLSSLVLSIIGGAM